MLAGLLNRVPVSQCVGARFWRRDPSTDPEAALTSAPARLTLDLLAWRLNRPSAFDADDTRFLSALTGGFLLGWGVMIGCLSQWVYPSAPEPVRRTVLTSLLAWFCLDSTGSIASGHPSNAAINILVLLIAVGPLWRAAKAEMD